MTEEKIQELKETFDSLPVIQLIPDSLKHLKPVAGYLSEYYEGLGDGSQKYLGIPTGLDWLDKITLGLRGLIVLGGEPGAGKTSLALCLSYGASKQGTPVIFYSLEQGRKEIITILISQLSKQPYQDIQLKGKLLDTELKQAKEELEDITERYYIRSYDEGQEEITLEKIKEEIQGVKALHGTDKVLVVIDQVQDLEVEARTQTEREGEIIRGLKKIGTATGACILGVSHQSKEAIKGSNQSMTAIKGSVDLIYKPDSVWGLAIEEDEGTPGEKQVSLYFSKARDYEKKEIKLTYTGAKRTFDFTGYK